MMKNIAVVTTGYYPDMSPISAVLDKYIQSLKGKYHFSIIALQTRTNFSPLNDSNIDVYYMNGFWRKIDVKYKERCKANPNFIDKVIYKIVKVRGALLGLLEAYSVFKWTRDSSYNLLEKISKNTNFDTIISVSGLFLYLHEGAMKYKEKHPQVKWITFVTDPISYSSLDHKRIKINEKRKFQKMFIREKRVYEFADFNIFTENLYFDALEKFQQPEEKTIQFRFVLDDALFIDRPNVSERPSKAARLIYAGALYRIIRNPECMLSVISKVPDIRLDMYVRTDQCMDILRKYESERIVVNGGVSIDRYKEMICCEYDVLINIGNNCENQLPSKTLELLSSGRPILNFYYHKDLQYEMIERYPLGLNVGRDDANAVEKVSLFCREMKGKQLSFEQVESLYPENSMGNHIILLERLLN